MSGGVFKDDTHGNVCVQTCVPSPCTVLMRTKRHHEDSGRKGGPPFYGGINLASGVKFRIIKFKFIWVEFNMAYG